MQTSTPRLSEVARHLRYPATITTSGWPKVVAQCAEMGVRFERWQDGIGTLALGKRKDGKYAATVGGVVLSIPRQVGKTFLVGMMVIALCILFPGLTVLWTAHRTRTATKTFGSMQGYARRRKIWPHIARHGIRTTNGEQEIRFRNGSVIMFGAREQGFGRGFDEVDVEVFDEAQILTEKALEDMVPATNQSRHDSGALLFFIGTPPRPTDPGEEFTNRRAKALEGKFTNGVFVEFSADRDADPDDQLQWSKANPSYPSRTPLESMQRMRENLTDDESFLREALGIWDQLETHGVIPLDAWVDRHDEESFAEGNFSLGIEVGPDMAFASVTLAGQRPDGDWHVELAESKKGAAWTVAYVRALIEANPQIRAVVVDVSGPVQTLLDEYREANVRLTEIKVHDLGVACSRLLDGTMTGWLRNSGQPQLDAAVKIAGKRTLGDTGMWVFSRKTTVSDITAVQSAALALWGAQAPRHDVKRPTRSAQDDGSVIVL